MITHFQVGALAHDDSGPTHEFDLALDRHTRIAFEDDPTWRWSPAVHANDESRTRVEFDACPVLNPHATSSADNAPAVVAKAEVRGTDQRDIPDLLWHRQPPRHTR